jgi:heme/copper-type cytochrome/quinol oxidase subunit 4
MVLPGDIQSAAIAFATVLSLTLVAIAVLSYRRAREGRILLISIAFALFFIKYLVTSYLLLTEEIGNLFVYSALFDTAVLLSFYLALFRRR